VKLSVNVTLSGRYIRAGTELPSDFELPDHLKDFVVSDNPREQRSQHLSAVVVDEKTEEERSVVYEPSFKPRHSKFKRRHQ
jgi:hypothetical protein